MLCSPLLLLSLVCSQQLPSTTHCMRSRRLPSLPVTTTQFMRGVCPVFCSCRRAGPSERITLASCVVAIASGCATTVMQVIVVALLSVNLNEPVSVRCRPPNKSRKRFMTLAQEKGGVMAPRMRRTHTWARPHSSCVLVLWKEEVPRGTDLDPSNSSVVSQKK